MFLLLILPASGFFQSCKQAIPCLECPRPFTRKQDGFVPLQLQCLVSLGDTGVIIRIIHLGSSSRKILKFYNTLKFIIDK